LEKVLFLLTFFSESFSDLVGNHSIVARQNGWPGGSRRAVLVFRVRARLRISTVLMAAARQDGWPPEAWSREQGAWSIKTEIRDRSLPS